MANVPENFDNCLKYCPRAAGNRDNPGRFDAILGGAMLVQCPGPVYIEYASEVYDSEPEATEDEGLKPEGLTLESRVMCGAIYDVSESEDINKGKARVLTQQELREEDY